MVQVTYLRLALRTGGGKMMTIAEIRLPASWLIAAV
jgi:hypothetical protein